MQGKIQWEKFNYLQYNPIILPSSLIITIFAIPIQTDKYDLPIDRSCLFVHRVQQPKMFVIRK